LGNHVKRIVDPVVFILLIFFGVSLITLIVYLIDFNFSDTNLLILLTEIRFSSFILCVCAFYKLAVKIYHSIRDRKFYFVKILIYLVIIAYGTAAILMSVFIITLSGGNG
jgi:hypothetical protein